MRFQLLFGEALRSARASLSTTFAATMTVLIGMFLLGLAIALGSWVNSWNNNVQKELLVKVFFCTNYTCKQEATPEQINQVRVTLEGNPLVKEVRFVSKEEALEIMRKRSPELVKDLSYNPLPDAEEVVPKDPDDVKKITASLEPVPAGVEKVDYGRETADRILRVGRIIFYVFVAVVLILLGASALLIANTIRLSIYARRREIEVMKLVGASNWFVRGPFMLEGLFCGVVGSILAVILLLLGKELALPAILGHVNEDSEAKAWAFPLIALSLLGVGLSLGAASSGITLRRFLRV